MSDKMREAFERWAKSECIDTDSVDGFYSDNDTHIAWGSWQAAQSAAVPVVGEVVAYDAGLLSDFGGGNVEWWQDYIRAELARAHEFYVSQSAPEVVPIVSKTVGYLAGGTLMRRKIQGYDCKPLIIQPTTAITAAELERLQRNDSRLDAMMKVMFDDWHPIAVAFNGMPRVHSEDELLKKLDAAIAGEK